MFKLAYESHHANLMIEKSVRRLLLFFVILSEIINYNLTKKIYIIFTSQNKYMLMNLSHILDIKEK